MMRVLLFYSCLIYSDNMNPLKFLKMGQNFKGITSLILSRIFLNGSKNLTTSPYCFSHRFEVFKGLEVDTVLRNFTVFKYTQDKVGVLYYSVFYLCLYCIFSFLLITYSLKQLEGERKHRFKWIFVCNVPTSHI